VDNGQTLCSEHNFLKKTYSQTEFGKRFIIRLYKDALIMEIQIGIGLEGELSTIQKISL
jgi:hypothetical protein